MRIAIIGAGISGMASAWFLQPAHDVTLYDKADRLGGHVHSIPVECNGVTVQVETGVEFFVEATYPCVMALWRVLGLRRRKASATLTITFRDGGRTLALPPRSPRHLLQLLLSPRRLGQLMLFTRFTRSTDELTKYADLAVSLGEYARQRGFPKRFQEEMLFPLIAASWGAPVADMRHFPVYDVMKIVGRFDRAGYTFCFLDNGLGDYLNALAAELRSVEMRLGRMVKEVRKDGELFLVEDDRGEVRSYDQVVLATASPDAVSLVANAPELRDWCDVLGRFRHFPTTIAVHGDPAFMPANPHDWSLCNVFHEGDRAWLSVWSGWRQRLPIFRTWLQPGGAVPRALHYRADFHHLIVTPQSFALQQQIAAQQGHAGLWVVGMYTVDTDSHESALMSALPVARVLAPASPNLRRLEAAMRGADTDHHALDFHPPPVAQHPPRQAAGSPAARDA